MVSGTCAICGCVGSVTCELAVCTHWQLPGAQGEWGTHGVGSLPSSRSSFFPQNQVIAFLSSFCLIAKGGLVPRFTVGVILRFWSFLAAGTFMGKGRCRCQVERTLWTQGMVRLAACLF